MRHGWARTSNKYTHTHTYSPSYTHSSIPLVWCLWMTGKCRVKQRYDVFFLKRFHGTSKLGLYYKTHVAIVQIPSDLLSHKPISYHSYYYYKKQSRANVFSVGLSMRTASYMPAILNYYHPSYTTLSIEYRSFHYDCLKWWRSHRIDFVRLTTTNKIETRYGIYYEYLTQYDTVLSMLARKAQNNTIHTWVTRIRWVNAEPLIGKNKLFKVTSCRTSTLKIRLR